MGIFALCPCNQVVIGYSAHAQYRLQNGFELAEGIGRCKDRFLAILRFKSGRGECVFYKETNSVRQCMIKFGSCQYEIIKTNVLINAHSNLCLFCLHLIG